MICGWRCHQAHKRGQMSSSASSKQGAADSAASELNENTDYLGFGVGLRSQHFPEIMACENLPVDWFEIISENFIDNHGYGRKVLKELRSRCPIVMHGVSLNVGSSDPLNWEYLQKLKELAEFVQPSWISDHLCWTGILGHNTHDLLPMPLTEESLNHVSERVLQVQAFLGQPILLENPSTYLEFRQNELSEWEFLSLLVKKTNCLLLLDVNNVFVSSFNHGYDPLEYLRNIPHSSIQQVHLAGPTRAGNCLVDTHDQPVPDQVWELYKVLLEKTGPVSTLLEWDANIPGFSEVVAELNKARLIFDGKPYQRLESVDINQAPSVFSSPVVR
ncbi:DUF692 domain-containing protein [Pseudovibrio sp. Ad13]|uniref:MNIO family bufferin maturase n=1 Tax=Pseudovibrio sp. Ad13 TaxID=989396 RepID=UPI0031BB8535